MLDYGHNPYLVAASLAIALMSGFTGLSLTRGASAMPPVQRKLVVAMSAVALGGGIWSMHFVAMLGLRLPVLFYYDALVTLASALVAILLTGLALLLVHFGERTPRRIVLAGATIGVGIPVMHYLGMSGMQLCRPVYSPVGVGLAALSSLMLCIGSFWICYGQRTARSILLGTVGFGFAVFAVHFIAMAGTGFVKVESATAIGPALSNDVLAFGVTIAAFVISGGFLLTGVTFAEHPAQAMVPAPDAPEPEAQPREILPIRIPFEKDGRTHFLPECDVAAVRAEGHYCFIYAADDRLFSPWSITMMEENITDPAFVRSHRSYLVNTRFVSSFERKKDSAVCYFDGVDALEKAPVSRSRIGSVLERLGL
ncbi:MAG: MHYT domain-containing protein [Pseudomonadota bacterium]